MTLAQLRSMSEREFHLWIRFASQKGFPERRQEIQLAMIALTVARSIGGNEGLTLDDFMLQKAPQKNPTAEEHAMTLGDLSGRGVRKLGQGRKKK